MTPASCVGVLASSLAAASGFEEHGVDLVPRERAEVRLSGYLRARGEDLYNLDLDRGTTPSGRPLYPVPLADPTGQNLTHADARLRTELSIYAPGGSVAVKLRADLLDNLALGADPELSPGYGAAPTPAASAGQRPLQLLRLKRAYGEAMTPLGLVAAGRMGAHWGLGILSGGGDCLDCDGGDSADRVAFVTSIAGHLWAAACDFSAVGPTSARPSGTRAIDLEPSDDVRSFTFAVMRYRDELARKRRSGAGKATFEYGAYLSLRRQENDVPSSYLPAVEPATVEPSQVIRRGYQAAAMDFWVRLTLPWARMEAEAALLVASADQVSLVPGVLLRDAVRSTQLGAALQTDFGSAGAALELGLDLGFASGDPAPGFGAFPTATSSAPGELEGPQAALPRDTRVDNFRFHPDFRIDRILFAEIIGTVTDAAYVRPHAGYRLLAMGRSALRAELAAVASRAIEPASTPGGSAELGVELDSALAYGSGDGFDARLEHAVLFPLAGLANPAQGLSPTPAQLFRLRLAYLF
ncbi:MAG: TIGR04551 family protein [Myxococcales bacterium]|nr:TIGR04551 family protein [Myxococcales bacterium]